MAFIKTWDESIPQGTRSISLGDNDIRDFKYAMRERLAEEHNFFSDESTESNIGLHKKVTLLEQAADPTVLANSIILYGKLSGGKTELHSVAEDDVVSQLTYLGKLWINGFKVAAEADNDFIQFNGTIWDRYPWDTFVTDLLADPNFLAGLPTKYAWDIVQIVQTESAAYANGSTSFPYDDTIPQITEGTEVFTVAITPTYANSKLLIEACVRLGGHSGSNADWDGAVAIFRDSTANAIVSAYTRDGLDGGMMDCKLSTLIDASSTNATTFRVRVGSPNYAWSLNHYESGARLFGGTNTSYIRVTELKQ